MGVEKSYLRHYMHCIFEKSLTPDLFITFSLLLLQVSSDQHSFQDCPGTLLQHGFTTLFPSSWLKLLDITLRQHFFTTLLSDTPANMLHLRAVEVLEIKRNGQPVWQWCRPSPASAAWPGQTSGFETAIAIAWNSCNAIDIYIDIHS